MLVSCRVSRASEVPVRCPHPSRSDPKAPSLEGNFGRPSRRESRRFAATPWPNSGCQVETAPKVDPKVSPEGHRAVTVGAHSAWVWDIRSGALERELVDGHEGFVEGVTFADLGARVVTCSSDGEVLIWDIGAGALRRVTMSESVLGVFAVPRSDLVIASLPSRLAVLNSTSGKHLRSLDSADDVHRVAVSSHGHVVVTCSGPSEHRRSQTTTVWAISGLRLWTLDEDESDSPTFSSDRGCSVAIGDLASPIHS